MQRTLQRKLIGPKAHRQLLAFLGEHLPRFTPPTSAAAWGKQVPALRAQVLDLFFRGHPKGLLAEQPQIDWGDRIETGAGYTIRKLRYEGYPGLWVPALLYEPDQLGGKSSGRPQPQRPPRRRQGHGLQTGPLHQPRQARNAGTQHRISRDGRTALGH